MKPISCTLTSSTLPPPQSASRRLWSQTRRLKNGCDKAILHPDKQNICSSSYALQAKLCTGDKAEADNCPPQTSRSTEDGLAHVDLNRNVDALYVETISIRNVYDLFSFR